MTMKKRQAVSQENPRGQGAGQWPRSMCGLYSLSLSVSFWPSSLSLSLCMGDGFHPPFKVEFLANTSFGARENDPYSSGRAGSHNSFLFSDTYKSLNCIKLNAKRTTPPLPKASKKKKGHRTKMAVS